MGKATGLFNGIRTIVIGRARSLRDPELFRKLSLIPILAWVGLGSDGLTSSSYGPEEAFLALGSHTAVGVFVAAATALTIFVIAASYSQLIEVFPRGGGGYVVASKLLNPTLGMASGCALLVDYILTIALSISSGTDALLSALPAQWLSLKIPLAVLGVLFLIVLNLRGVRESVLTLAPVFLVFLGTHLFAVGYGIGVHVPDVRALAAATSSEVRQTVGAVGTAGLVFIILRAFSMGAGTFTGIEAVSDAMPILREPKVATGKRTMRYMAVSLAALAAGLMVCYLLFSVQREPGRTLNATLFDRLASGWGATGRVFVTVTLLSEAVFLVAAAQTGFLGAPRVLGYMSMDRWFPQQFSLLSERFVVKNGTLLTGAAALVLLLATRGSVQFMVVLYSINVFLTFTFSQLGMVRHWWLVRHREPRWLGKIAVNGIGLLLTLVILVAMIVLKFGDGGWITLLVTGSLMAVAVTIKRFYARTQKQLRHLDTLVKVVEATRTENAVARGEKKAVPRFKPRARTAVILVGGYNGMGLHTLFNAVRLLGRDVKNFVFIRAGVVDAERFKGRDELEKLERDVKESLDRYVDYVRGQGYYGRGIPLLATDVVDEVCSVAEKLITEYPSAVFFGGRIVFHEESFLTRLLYNYVTFAVQRRLGQLGIPFVIVPVPVSARQAGGALAGS